MIKWTRYRAAAGMALGLMFAVLTWQAWLFLAFSIRALRWPFGLDYGEGIVWQQANMMFTPRAYAGIDSFPAIVFHYPPVYHVAARALAAVADLNMLVAGRAVSMGAALLTSVLIGAISARSAPPDTARPAKYLAGAGAALVFFCFVPVTQWAHLMRVDMLANALSVAGFWLALKAWRRPGLILAAAVCFVGAVFTKQTALAAPAAIFLMALWLRPRLAIALALACLALGLAVLGSLELLTGGGFLRHIAFYNINRLDLSGLDWIAITVRSHQSIFIMALFSIIVRTYECLARHKFKVSGRLAADSGDVAWIGLIFYFITSTLLLGTIAKSGSNVNYLLEWLIVIAMLVGGGLAQVAQSAFNPLAESSVFARVANLMAPLMLAAGAMHTASSNFTSMIPADRAPALAALSERVRGAVKPIISDDMVMLLQNGKEVVWEPAIFAELATTGVWVERPFVERILHKEFEMFITEGQRGDVLFDKRYIPPVADAMDAAYPVLVKQGDYTLHLPSSAKP